MYNIQYYISLWISLLWPPKVVYRDKLVEVIVKDPNGLIQNDLRLIKSMVSQKQYKVGDSLESVAYRQAQEDFIALIETKIIGRG